MGQEDCNVHDKPPSSIPDGREKNRKYRDKAGFREAQIHCSLEEGKQKARKGKKRTCSQPKKQKKCQTDNKENIQNPGYQHIPQEVHAYENVKTEVGRDCNLSNGENVQVISLNHGQDAHVERHNSALQALFTSLEVEFDQN